VPYALLLLFAGSIVMAEVSPFYQLALMAQVVFYLLAGYGAVIELHARRQCGGGARTAVVGGGPPPLTRMLRELRRVREVAR
jgi:hypothetical protein